MCLMMVKFAGALAVRTLERQYVVGLSVHNGLSDFALATHCIQGDDCPLQRQHLQ